MADHVPRLCEECTRPLSAREKDRAGWRAGWFCDDCFWAGVTKKFVSELRNEFYIDLERIPEFAGQALPEPLKQTKLVDYRGVMAHKRRILEQLAETFFSDAAPKRLQAFGKFLRANEGVKDYARFRAVMDRQRQPWQTWPARLRDGNERRGSLCGRRRRRPDLPPGRDVGGLGLHGRARRRALFDRKLKSA